MDHDQQFDDAERRTHVRTLIDLARRQAVQSTTNLRNALPATASGVPDFGSDYEVIGEIHRGGQGIVYRARQRSTGRVVAIKLMREGPFSSVSDRIRFEREVHILGQLNHKNIVGILNTGVAHGSAYFVMDFVAGQPLNDWAAEVVDQNTVWNSASLRILPLFIRICDAVHTAHLHGVIHRDLKPSNILVDESEEPHILDFGVAKLEKENRVIDVTMTSPGHFIGSLPWASPEQVAGLSHEIDIRSDVYSLGAILYQLLTGKLPHSITENVRDVLERITTTEPLRPGAIRSEIDHELETIIMKCLAKEPDRRYQSAGELARDLRHYLADEPIEAKRDSTWYVVGKTIRRHRRSVSAAVAFLVLVAVSSIALSFLYARQAVLLAEVKKQRDKSTTAEKLAGERFEQAKYESYVANIAAAAAAISANDGGAALKRLQSAPGELRNWEWKFLRTQSDQSAATWRGPAGFITSRVRISLDNQCIGASYWMEGQKAVLRTWPQTGDGTFAELKSAGTHLPFEFIGERGKLISCDRDGFISRRDTSKLHETSQQEFGESGVISPIEMSSGGRFLLFSRNRGQAVWDTENNRLVCTLALPEFVCADFDSHGRLCAIGQFDGKLSVWDTASGRELTNAIVNEGIIYGVAFSPDDRHIATSGGENGELKLWELTGGESSSEAGTADFAQPSLRLIREFRDGVQRIGLVSFSPDGHFMVAPSEDKAVRIWDVRGNEPPRRLLGHTTGVVSASFSHDARWLVSGAREGVVKLWDLQRSPSTRVIRGLPAPANFVAVSRSGQWLVVNCEGIVCVFDCASGQRVFERPLSAANLQGLLSGPGDSQVTLSTSDGAIHVWEIGADEETLALKVHRSAPLLAGNQSNSVIVSADADSVILWDWPSARETRRFAGPGKSLRCLALNDDASLVAIALQDGGLQVLETEHGTTRMLLRSDESPIASAAFSPDGRSLTTVSTDQWVKLWEMAAGRLAWSTSLDFGDVWSVRFSPDGSRLAVGGRDRSVRLFNVTNGQEVLALRGPTGTVMCLDFSPDGRTIVAGSWAREIFVWGTLDVTE